MLLYPQPNLAPAFSHVGQSFVHFPVLVEHYTRFASVAEPCQINQQFLHCRLTTGKLVVHLPAFQEVE
jgi:hypothetical protein